MGFAEKSDDSGVWVPGWWSSSKQLKQILCQEQRHCRVVAGGLFLSGPVK